MDNGKKVALFIDAENVGAEYADKVMGVARGYGELIIKRIYGGSKTRPIADWREKSGEYAILSEIRYVYTAKKNASDIALAVDVMNTLHERNVDVFCIASSDSDFTALAHELRERGKKVIGMGLKTANPTYKSALSEPYIELDKDEVVINADKTVKIVETVSQKSNVDKIIGTIINTIEALIVEKGSALMATLGNRLRNSKELEFSAFYDKNKDGNLTDFLLKYDEINKRYKKIGKKTDTTLVKKDAPIPQLNIGLSDGVTNVSKTIENKSNIGDSKALTIVDDNRQKNTVDNKQQNQLKTFNDAKTKSVDNKVTNGNTDKKPSNERQNSLDNQNDANKQNLTDKPTAVNKPKLANKQYSANKQSMANKNNNEKISHNVNSVNEPISTKPKENKKRRGNRSKKNIQG